MFKWKYFLVLLLQLPVFPAISQSIYQFEYHFHSPKDTVSYKALFLLFADGTATARVRFNEPGNNQAVIVDMSMKENMLSGPDENPDTSGLRYVYKSHRFITNQNYLPFDTTIEFIFKNDPVTGFNEPFAVGNVSAGRSGEQPGIDFQSVLMDKNDIRRSIVQQFFIPGEDFYQAFVSGTARGSMPDESGTRMFLLAVANISDPEIGMNCKKDMDRTIESFINIGHEMGFPDNRIIVKTVSGDNYSKKNVLQAIAELKPTPKKDIVVFYYSGHGFRKVPGNGASRFPYIDLRTKSDSNYYVQSLNMEKDIFNRILTKKARFNLVMGDCCNIEVPVPKPRGRSIGGKPRGASILLKRENCLKLFMDDKPLSILACAADTGLLAISNPDLGGFFSYFLKNSMDTYCSIFRTNPTWEQIMKDTYEATIDKSVNTYCDRPFIPENVCKPQKPIYKTIPARL